MTNRKKTKRNLKLLCSDVAFFKLAVRLLGVVKAFDLFFQDTTPTQKAPTKPKPKPTSKAAALPKAAAKPTKSAAAKERKTTPKPTRLQSSEPKKAKLRPRKVNYAKLKPELAAKLKALLAGRRLFGPLALWFPCENE